MVTSRCVRGTSASGMSAVKAARYSLNALDLAACSKCCPAAYHRYMQSGLAALTHGRQRTFASLGLVWHWSGIPLHWDTSAPKLADSSLQSLHSRITLLHGAHIGQVRPALPQWRAQDRVRANFQQNSSSRYCTCSICEAHWIPVAVHLQRPCHGFRLAISKSVGGTICQLPLVQMGASCMHWAARWTG